MILGCGIWTGRFQEGANLKVPLKQSPAILPGIVNYYTKYDVYFNNS